MSKRLGVQALALLLGIGLFVSVRSQSSTAGNITGTVHDQQGAAVAKAEVTIQEQNTKASRTVTTNDDGFYSATSLTPGRYTVSVTPQGFKKTVVSDVELHVSENKTVNLEVQVGQVTEVVNVTSEGTQVETRSGEVSSLIAEKQVTELPLNGRNYAQLALMVPGVSPVTQAGAGGAFRAGGTGLDSGVDMSVNGNQSNSNLWTVDGVNNMDVGSNRTLLVFPSIDSIQEFRVERNSFSAEFGQAQGAVVNLITKGGGNDFHGTGFYFLRDDSLNANDFFLNRNGQPKGDLKYKNFGFNFNGPIWKNKIFFFWSEEWRRQKRGQVLTGFVPTAAEKVGDFSGVRTGPLPHQPGLICTTPGPAPTDPGCFPGNKIPTNQLSAVGLAILSRYPDPNSGNVTSSPNWSSAPTQPTNTRQDLIRGDINITDKMNVMVRWIKETWIHGVANGNFWGDSPFPTLSSDWEQPSHSFAVKLTNVISSTTVNDFQFSKAGNDIIIGTSAGTQALNDKIASIFPTVFPHENDVGNGPPPLFWGPGGYETLWHQAPWNNREDLFIWKDDFSKVIANHEVKLGVLFSHNLKEEPSVGASGSNQPYAISGCGNKTGNCLADLLVKDLPLVNYAEIDHTEIANGRWRDFEFYGNDTWKLKPTLTLTLGLRYSMFPPAWEAENRISNFIPRLYNGVDFNTGLVTADEAENLGIGRATIKTYKAGFQPRVGLAWDVFGDGKTALRLGFGRFMSRANVIEDLLRLTQNPPWTIAVASAESGANDTLATCPTCRSLDTINPGLRNAVAGFSATSGFNAVDENYRPPESYQWNLTVSRELMRNTVLEASYIGNHGLHIWRRNVPRNDVRPSARLAIATAIRNGASTDTLVAANRVLPGIGPLPTDESTGNSSYHAMQLWLNRRFANRLAFQVAYTWGHAISDVSLTSFTNTTIDPFDYRADKGDADLDRRHTFVGNLVYVLPRFSRWGSVAEHVLGDWQINGIFSYYGATPIAVTSEVNTMGTAQNVGQRPDLVLGVPVYLHTGDSTQHLNPAAFALPAVGRNGNLGKGAIRGKPITNLDFSLTKNWKVKERYGIQFRTEVFNLLNHPNFVGFSTALNFEGNQTQPNFGKPTNTAFGTLNSTQSHREIQFGLKFTF
jgi:Carboxypeptidase regulatory-like domain